MQDDEQVQSGGPDDEAGPAVDPIDPAAQEGSGEGAPSGQQEGEQVPTPINPGSFDPDQPVRTSAPDPQEQSGVPQPTDGANEGVEAQEQYRGPVDPAQADNAHAEANAFDSEDAPGADSSEGEQPQGSGA